MIRSLSRCLQAAALVAAGVSFPAYAASFFPTLSYTVPSADFSQASVGSPGVARAVSFSNSGMLAITNLGVAIGGPQAADFSRSTTCGATLPPRSSCTVTVTFKPSAAGTRSATLKVTGSAVNAPASIALTGVGVGAAPTTVGYANLSASAYSAAQSAKTMSFTVNRSVGSGGSGTAVSVRYATQNGTAIAGSDYTAVSGTVSWTSGDTAAKSVSIPLGPTGFDGTRTFSIVLSNPSSGLSLGTVTTATVSLAGSGAAPTTPPVGTGPTAASLIAAKIGKPSRLLVGLGTGSSTDEIARQGLKPDFYDRYLVGVGKDDWTTWNSPAGQYVNEVARFSDQMGAVPMFTLYQMAANGDGNLSGLRSTSFMTGYWNNVRLLFQRLAIYGKPAVVNFEPDFWGYVGQQSGSANPNQTFAYVNIASECAALPNDVSGLASCLMLMARTYAPKAIVGFPPSEWGANTIDQVITFMNQLGAQRADFVVMQTLDGDVGCYEAASGRCQRPGVLYWDETNTRHPNFADHFATAKRYRDGIGGLPLLWWQTPLGVPSDQPGGTARHFRDNRAHYFLTHPAEVVAAGGFGVVFSNGDDVTGIATDGGQFRTLSLQYLATPAALK